MIFTNLHAATNTWNTVGEAKEKGLFDFDFIKWMAYLGRRLAAAVTLGAEWTSETILRAALARSRR